MTVVAWPTVTMEGWKSSPRVTIHWELPTHADICSTRIRMARSQIAGFSLVRARSVGSVPACPVAES